MRILTNPFFGSGKLARERYCLNQDISILLTAGTFSQKVMANKIIYVQTDFGPETWRNVILVNNSESNKIKGRLSFSSKYSKNLIKSPQGKYMVRVGAWNGIVNRIELVIDDQVIKDSGRGGHPSKGIVFNTQQEQEEYYELVKGMMFVPDIIISNSTGEKSDHLTKEQRKEMDAHYTPDELADIMVSYLVGEGPVLDPFCGKGSLLRAAIRNNKVEERDIYGWDIDPVAIQYCKEHFPLGHFEVKNSLL